MTFGAAFGDDVPAVDNTRLCPQALVTNPTKEKRRRLETTSVHYVQPEAMSGGPRRVRKEGHESRSTCTLKLLCVRKEELITLK